MASKRDKPKKVRCCWAKTPLLIAYHDDEWGVPLWDDQQLFEFLILEGAQAGLSWETVLSKRDHYRKVMNNFEPEKIARYSARKIEQLLADPGIIRNRLKVESAVRNARAYLKVRQEQGSFAKYLWQFVGGKPIINRWRTLREVPVNTPESDAMSKDLKRRDFNFVGSTICYALMQATGMVNDHTVDCFRYQELQSRRKKK